MICGMDILLDRKLKLLKGRRVGLLSHQAALVEGGATSAQAMRSSIGRSLKALFGPEHGFLGLAGAGEKTYSTTHPDWNIPVHSLYGEMRSPSAEMLSGLDVVVCDLQDLGIRCYTYLATLFNMYKACRDAGVDLIVTDRPVPLPSIVDGAMPEPELMSFVAPCSVPMVYGMTPAETVRWMSADDELGFTPVAVPMRKWKRSDSIIYKASGEFMPPSPGIKSCESALVYASLVFCEALPSIDCGRGTNMAFRVFGTPWLESEVICRLLNRRKMAGVEFHPHRYTAAVGALKGRELDGVRLSVTDPSLFHPVECSLYILRELEKRYGEGRVWRHKGVRQSWFDKLYGDSCVRRDLRAGKNLNSIFGLWRSKRADFMNLRDNSLIYA